MAITTITGIEMDGWNLASGVRARRLKAIAKWINARSAVLHITAEVKGVRVSTDTPLAGTRLRNVGKGRDGNELRIFSTRALAVPSEFHVDPQVMTSRGTTLYGARALVHRHNSAETYRSNDEVERWLFQFVERLEVVYRGTRRKLAAFNKSHP